MYFDNITDNNMGVGNVILKTTEKDIINKLSLLTNDYIKTYVNTIDRCVRALEDCGIDREVAVELAGLIKVSGITNPSDELLFVLSGYLSRFYFELISKKYTREEIIVLLNNFLPIN